MNSNLPKKALLLLIPILGITAALMSVQNAGSETAAIGTTEGGNAPESAMEEVPSPQAEVPLVAEGRGASRQTDDGLLLLERIAEFENAFFERQLDDTTQSVIDRVVPFADASYVLWLETYFSLDGYEEGRQQGLVHKAEADPRGMEVLYTGSLGDEVWVTARFTVREFDAETGEFVRSFREEHRSSWVLNSGQWYITDLPPDTS